MGEKKKRRQADIDAAQALAVLPEMAEGTQPAQTETPAETPIASSAHPEEMKASVTLRIGDKVSLSATARATPAGLVASALIVTAAMVPLIWITRRRD